MRLYLMHRKYYIAFLNAQNALESILDEQEVLMQKVQPKSSLAEHEREFLPSNPVTGGSILTRKAEEYAIEVERRAIKERLSEAREILSDRKLLLQIKEEELRKSKDIYNKIYTCKWVDGMKAEAIIEETGYSRSQVYNIINHLTTQLERGDYGEEENEQSNS